MCEFCDWEEYHEALEEMLNEDKYEYASDFLEGVYCYVAENEHITDRQKESINNVIVKTKD